MRQLKLVCVESTLSTFHSTGNCIITNCDGEVSSDLCVLIHNVNFTQEMPGADELLPRTKYNSNCLQVDNSRRSFGNATIWHTTCMIQIVDLWTRFYNGSC